MNVTPNLGAALQQLRYSDRTRILWVDAICINQKDLDELARQVSIMGDVYEFAYQVVIWLGEDTGFAATAVSILQRAAKHAVREIEENPEITDLQNLRRGRRSISESAKKDMPDDNSFERNSLDRFANSNWFTRIWVLQEIGRARNAIMLVGSSSIEAFEAVFGISWLKSKDFERANCAYLKMIPTLSMSSLHRQVGNRPELDQTSDLASQIALMSALSRKDAIDPRDRVFALLGLQTTASAVHLASNYLLRPNYRKSVVEVYKDAVRYLVTLAPPSIQALDSGVRPGMSGPRLDVLLFSGCRLGKGGFPYWVPRWDSSRVAKYSFWLRPLAQTWLTGSSSLACVGDAHHPDSLVLKGLNVDAINSVPDDWDALSIADSRDFIKVLISQLRAKISKLILVYPGSDSIEDAFAATVTAGSDKSLFYTGLFTQEGSQPFRSQDLAKLIDNAFDLFQSACNGYNKRRHNFPSGRQQRWIMLHGRRTFQHAGWRYCLFAVWWGRIVRATPEGRSLRACRGLLRP
jgi:hypothetical protein